MNLSDKIKKTLVLIRGAGDLATGTAIRLHNSGFNVVMLEVEQPTVIRRTVSFASAVFTGEQTVEGVTARLCQLEDINQTLAANFIPVVVDPKGNAIKQLNPEILVDAIIAKQNLGTSKNMAGFVICLGPGFTAGVDCHAVIETQRGHTLGKIIYNGSAVPNTGIPGIVGNYGKERVLHSPKAGIFTSNHEIGDIVTANETIGFVDEEPVKTIIGGKLRGLLTSGLYVTDHFKIADVDPRGKTIDHTTCSDKARTISGGVLEAVLHHITSV